MAKVDFKLKQEDVDRFVARVEAFPGSIEVKVNDYLHNTAAPLVKDAIVDYLPISRKGKKHAKANEAFEVVQVNMGFVIRTEKHFNYLYFPDQGEGTSKKNQPQEFMTRGLNQVYEEIVDGMLASIGSTIEEEFE